MDANPKWVPFGPGADTSRRTALVFDCPIHDDFCFVGVHLRNPIGAPMNPNGWEHDGDDFETLTIRPSIRVLLTGKCEWHGYVTNGRIETLADSK